ncbi:MAG: LPS export ABC transporter periplasmic protein LptC [Sphingomonas sp.]
MSEVAAPLRTARQHWAAPGSGHDRIVAVARAALPMSIGVLGAFLVAAPLTMGGDVSFVLDKNKVAVATERMRLQTALYRGQDDKGQPFSLSAGSAVQKSSSEPIVQLQQLAAQILLADGPARLKSDAGRYNMESQQVTSDGPVNFVASNGYDLTASNATVDLKTRTMHSDGSVAGKGPQGTFSADRMQADLETHQVTLDGNVRLRIVPRRAR